MRHHLVLKRLGSSLMLVGLTIGGFAGPALAGPDVALLGEPVVSEPTAQPSPPARQPAAAGPDLVLTAIGDMRIRAGATATVPVTVRNKGDAVIDGVTVMLSPLEMAASTVPYDNCEPQFDFGRLACFYDVRLQPGDVFTPDRTQPWIIKVWADAAGPASYDVSVQVHDGTMKESAADLHPDDDTVGFAVDVPLNPADSVAYVTRLAGPVGAARTFRLGFVNEGPGDRVPLAGGRYAAAAVVRLPEGLRVTRVHPRCAPLVDGKPDRDRFGEVDGLHYGCYMLSAHVGSPESFSSTVTITGPAGEPGLLHIDGGVQDPDRANNDAPIRLDVTGGSAVADTDGATTTDLPVTGASTAALVGGAASMLGFGALAILVGRRRHGRTPPSSRG